MEYKRIFITGDKHGDFDEVAIFCHTHNTSREDLLIILGGEVRITYSGEEICNWISHFFVLFS